MKNSWNKVVAAKRGNKWRESMMAGKVENLLRPTRLRVARIELAKSQDEIAKALEMSVTTYGEIERGKRQVRSEMSERIANLVNRKRESIFVRSKGSKFIAIK